MNNADKPIEKETEYIASVKATIQVSPDDWERIDYCSRVSKDTTVEDLFNWANSVKGDLWSLKVNIAQAIKIDN